MWHKPFSCLLWFPRFVRALDGVPSSASAAVLTDIERIFPSFRVINSELKVTGNWGGTFSTQITRARKKQNKLHNLVFAASHTASQVVCNTAGRLPGSAWRAIASASLPALLVIALPPVSQTGGLEVGGPQIRVLADAASTEDLLPGLQMGAFSLWSHLAGREC